MASHRRANMGSPLLSLPADENSPTSSPKKASSPALGGTVSLKKLLQSHIEEFYQQYSQEAAQKQGVTVDDLPTELQQTLRGAAVKAATERIALIRRDLKLHHLASKAAEKNSPDSSPSKLANEQSSDIFAQEQTATSSPTTNLVKAESSEENLHGEKKFEPSTPESSLFILASTTPTHYLTEAKALDEVMSYQDLYGHQLSAEELEKMQSGAAGVQQSPQLLHDITGFGNDPFSNNSQGGRGSLFGASLNPQIVSSATPQGFLQTQDSHLPAQGHGFSNLMPSQNTFNQSSASPAGFHQFNDSISPVAQFAKAAQTGAQDYQTSFTPGDTTGTTHANVFDQGMLEDPFQNIGPATNFDEAKGRVGVQILRLNHLHEIRKQQNDKMNFNFAMQGSWTNEAIADCFAFFTGLRPATSMLADYNVGRDPQKLVSLYLYVEKTLIPKLERVGPSSLGKGLEQIVASIKDPEQKHSSFVHAANSLYLQFCGLKSALLIIDRHRAANPDLYHPKLPQFEFEKIFSVSRRQFYFWLCPVTEDHKLGDYDHYFMPVAM